MCIDCQRAALLMVKKGYKESWVINIGNLRLLIDAIEARGDKDAS